MTWRKFKDIYISDIKEFTPDQVRAWDSRMDVYEIEGRRREMRYKI